LAKAFDMVSRQSLFIDLQKIGCPPDSLVFRSLRGDMQARISFEGALSSPFKLKCGVKQGCVLSPILFGIFFSASSLITHSTTMTKTPPLISLKAIILARKSSATLHIFFK